jgi:16S rRNA (guanine527-N7)-methyltransferase
VKRLHEVCAEAGLDAEAASKLAALLDVLANDPAAPTSVTSPAEAVDVHVADSLSALPLLAARRSPEAIVDIGSGAGFPGLPLAVALGRASVDLVESTTRKCRFLTRVIEHLGQGNARAVCARIEDWARAEGAERYEVALARALAPLPTLVEYASPLLRDHGLLVAWKGERDPVEERQGVAAARALGMSARDIHRVSPFPGARHRYLHTFEKTGPTPAGIPRRPGMARKRPFGGESSAPNQSGR